MIENTAYSNILLGFSQKIGLIKSSKISRVVILSGSHKASFLGGFFVALKIQTPSKFIISNLSISLLAFWGQASFFKSIAFSCQGHKQRVIPRRGGSFWF
jgi:hypothetical protein